MKRFLPVLAISCLTLAFATLPVAAQEQEKKSVEAGEKEVAHAENSNEIYWKWANFVMLVGALGYLIAKQGGPLLAARTAEIQKGIREAAAEKREAETTARNVEQRLSRLQDEIDQLRANARSEMAAESDRQHKEAAAQLARIKEQGEQQIASAAKAAQQELQAYSAQLALELAETKIRQRLTPQTQDELIRGFVADLERNTAAMQQRAS